MSELKGFEGAVLLRHSPWRDSKEFWTISQTVCQFEIGYFLFIGYNYE